MALSKERKGEIAYAMLLHHIRKEGMGRLNSKEVRRGIGNALEIPELKEVNLTKDEAKEFIKDMIQNIMAEVLEELK